MVALAVFYLKPVAKVISLRLERARERRAKAPRRAAEREAKARVKEMEAKGNQGVKENMAKELKVRKQRDLNLKDPKDSR